MYLGFVFVHIRLKYSIYNNFACNLFLNNSNANEYLPSKLIIHFLTGRSHRSLPSSGGSMSSVSSNEGMVGTRRPPTSLSVLSASSLAEVSKTIRERHSSADGGLTPPPRVISVEDSRGMKIMTELVDPAPPNFPNDDNEKQNSSQITSKYVPLKPIEKRK